MKQFYTAIFLSLLASATLFAQPFVNTVSGLPGIGRGAVAFADFDNDHDLDVIISGQDIDYNPYAAVFRNDAGLFTHIETGIIPLENCALAIADYDLDGFQDFVITGVNLEGSKTFLYRNLGNFQFELMPAGFYNAGAGSDLAWADYNSDGFPDLVISGNWQTKLYSNNGDGTFALVEAGLVGMNTPSLAWGDADNDGNPDLLMSGDAGSVGEAYIYINDQGIFNLLETQIEGAVGGDAQWGDADNDGNLDILITGKDASLIPVSYVYRNNGDKTFSFANAGLVGTALGPANWIDYDNDGDLDIMVAGQNAGCGNASTRLYTNNGIGSFSEFPAGLAFAERAASAWGDYDNDGDIDLILTGISGIHTTKFYRNDLITNSFQQNTPPTVPDNLYTYVAGDYAVISWARSTDAQSPQNSITYNVMMGNNPGSINVISPMSDAQTGKRHTSSTGNAGQNDFLVFRNLQPGDYYFRVQAIDQAYEGSAFSQEGSFTVLGTDVKTNEHRKIDFNVLGDRIILNNLPEKPSKLSIVSADGKLISEHTVSVSNSEIGTQKLLPGIYILHLNSEGLLLSSKFVK